MIWVSADGGEEEEYFRDEFLEIIEPTLLDSLPAYKILESIKKAFSDNSSDYYIFDRVEVTIKKYKFNPAETKTEQFKTGESVQDSLNNLMNAIVHPEVPGYR